MIETSSQFEGNKLMTEYLVNNNNSSMWNYEIQLKLPPLIMQTSSEL